MRTLVTTALPLILVLAFAGCSDSDDGGGDGGSKDEAGTPACSEVWVIGETLPENYEGCMEGNNLTAVTGYECKDGGSLYALEKGGEDAMFGVTGQTIGDSTDEKAYGETYDACLGD